MYSQCWNSRMLQNECIGLGMVMTLICFRYITLHTNKLVTGRVGLFKECLRGHRLVNTMLRRNKSHSHCWNVNTCMAAFKFFGNKQ